MTYTLVLQMPNLDEGAEVEIDRLGIYANGGTYEIPSEVSDHFALTHGRTLGQAFKGSTTVLAFDPDEDLSDDDPDVEPLALDELPPEALDEMKTTGQLPVDEMPPATLDEADQVPEVPEVPAEEVPVAPERSVS